MKPFFSYYGSKWTGAKHYGAPRRDVVIEPFAGSACYSVRWDVPVVRLYDVSEDICALWDFLINCSDRDIRDIPDTIESSEHMISMDKGQRNLVGFWVAKGRAEPSNVLSPWYSKHKGSHDCTVWGAAVKDIIIKQKPLIVGWTIERLSYEKIPMTDAHWHVDPPYKGSPGRRYPNSDIDFNVLSDWCKSLSGTVDVCENVGADWLPFAPLYDVVSSRGRRDGTVSKEAVWRSPTPS